MGCNSRLELFLQRGEQADVTEVHGEPGWVGRMAELGIRGRLPAGGTLQPGSPCVSAGSGEFVSFTVRGDSVFQILVRPAAR